LLRQEITEMSNMRQTKEEETVDIPRLLSVQEVEEMLGISERAVNRLVREGRLGYVRLTRNKKGFTLNLVREFIKGETIRRSQDGDEDQVRGVSCGHIMNPCEPPGVNYCGHSPRNHPPGP
jgi:excisionase family DNA binding protein